MRAFSVVFIAAVAVLLGAGSSPTQKKDPFPSGCVSCHAKVPDGDHRLNVELKKVKHVGIASVKTVPGDCVRCHKGSATKPKFSAVVHKSHYGRGARSLFNKRFKGDCTHCHEMNGKTGGVTTKSGAKNW